MNIEQEIRAQIEKNKGLKLAVSEINNHLSILEGLLRNDVQSKVEEAYQKGYDKGYADKTNNDEVGKELAKDIYQRGLEDGRNETWEAARKISVIELNGGLTGKELMKIYGTMDVHKIYDDNTASEAIEKLKAYEEKQKAEEKIKVGDEVRAEDGTAVFVVTWMSENCICGVDLEGKCYSYEPREVCGKTGRKYSVGISDITRCTDDED